MTFFNAEDFRIIFNHSAYDLAVFCNEKLKRDAKVVYICDKEIKTLHFAQPVDATHTGILMCIEPLVKPKCEHSVNFKTATPLLLNDQQIFQCSKCPQKIKLKWEWEVADEQR